MFLSTRWCYVSEGWLFGWLLLRVRFVTLSSPRFPVAAVSRTRDRRFGLLVVPDVVPDWPDNFRPRLISGFLRRLIRNKREITQVCVKSFTSAWSLVLSGVCTIKLYGEIYGKTYREIWISQPVFMTQIEKIEQASLLRKLRNYGFVKLYCTSPRF